MALLKDKYKETAGENSKYFKKDNKGICDIITLYGLISFFLSDRVLNLPLGCAIYQELLQTVGDGAQCVTGDTPLRRF